MSQTPSLDASTTTSSANPTPVTRTRPSMAAAYSGDRAEVEIHQLKAEAEQIRRRAAKRQGGETTEEKLRTKEIQTEIQQKQAILAQYRSDARGVGLFAFAILFLISIIWILLDLPSPIGWMEFINKENRDREMMKATGGKPYGL